MMLFCPDAEFWQNQVQQPPRHSHRPRRQHLFRRMVNRWPLHQAGKARL